REPTLLQGLDLVGRQQAAADEQLADAMHGDFHGASPCRNGARERRVDRSDFNRSIGTGGQNGHELVTFFPSRVAPAGVALAEMVPPAPAAAKWPGRLIRAGS